MAIRTPVITPVYGFASLDGWQVVWSGLQNGDTGAPVGSTIGQQSASALQAPGGGPISNFADRTIVVTGTLGVGGSVAFEASNDGGANYIAMNDAMKAAGTVLAITTAPGMGIPFGAALWVRPHVTAGDGTTSLTVSAFFRKMEPLA